ncbi:hypothetical protein CHS0354_025298 [Potamilus streckersoni]|uniref:Uncharacterized protein n=1 Tax=Potamilus streckersoni TaxID=2493646 RepID=A0AAE0RYB5_9BIVA|nr:hypothetical protein CHS0354_025298 [Potamilus streckersoni]
MVLKNYQSIGDSQRDIRPAQIHKQSHECHQEIIDYNSNQSSIQSDHRGVTFIGGATFEERRRVFCSSLPKQWNTRISTAHYLNKGTKGAHKEKKKSLNLAKQEIKRKPMDYNNIEEKEFTRAFSRNTNEEIYSCYDAGRGKELRDTGSAVTPVLTGVLSPFPRPVEFCLWEIPYCVKMEISNLKCCKDIINEMIRIEKDEKEEIDDKRRMKEWNEKIEKEEENLKKEKRKRKKKKENRKKENKK